jgi:hypothetical protein
LEADLLDNKLAWSSINYRNKKECLEFFDNMKSMKELGRLIDNYDPQTEGILIIITQSLATWFVTVKLKSKIEIKMLSQS